MGFTLIEIALFLSVTAVLFVGITVGTNNSIMQQRYYDTVQNYAEFLRSIYSQVSNTQSVGQGNSEKAIYGKLVVFGESVDLNGEKINDMSMQQYGQQVFVYDVVGSVSNSGTGSTIDLLTEVKANVIFVSEWWDAAHKQPKTATLAGDVQSYVPKWGAAIETTSKATPFTGSILIVRHPRSGTINTLVSDTVVQANKALRTANEKYAGKGTYGISKFLTSKLSTFDSSAVIFCVNPDGVKITSKNRWEIRLAANARNASSVEVIDKDRSDNVCNK